MCDNTLNLWLIVFFVLSNACILKCMDELLKMKQDLLVRSMIIALCMAFIALGVYDSKVNYGYGIFGTNIGFLDLISLMTLLVGMEIYGSVDEPECEAIPIHNETH